MSKRMKYLAYAIAVIVVAGIMTVAIYAATSATSGITANVSWIATDGIEFELEAWVVNNSAGNGIGNTSTPKSIEKQIVTASTSNTTAQNLAGNLACSFYDGTDDGVNNPSNIVFTYKIKNTGSSILKVTATKTPKNQAESGTTASDHEPKVVLSSNYTGSNVTTSQTSAIYGTGYNIPEGGTLEYIVTLSMDNADLSIASFDAGVTFNFSVGNNIEVYIDGVSQTASTTATTIEDYVNTLDCATYPGYFYDAELLVPVPEEDYATTIGSGCVTLYTQQATLDKLTFTSNGDGTCSVSGNSPSGVVIIPLVSPDGDRVTNIGDEAFKDCTEVTSIAIPESVTNIGSKAFRGCSGLTRVTIPDSVLSIGNDAFRDCSGLTSITIPNGVTSIGDCVFGGCTLLAKIRVESENTTYDSRNNCNAIIETATNTLVSGCQTTIIPYNVTSIEYCAFYDCTGITSITIPDGVTSIGDYAFRGCSGLTSITIPNGVTSIGDYTFYNCTGITSITIPNSVTSIGGYTFQSCSGLISITIPDSVTSIGNGAFWDCSRLTSITIPNKVTRIAYATFRGCTRLISVIIPNGVKTIAKEAFYSCLELSNMTIPDSVTSIENHAFARCRKLTSITIPDGVTSIGESTFSACYGLTSITIPDSVTSIGSQAFSLCKGLASIYIPSSVTIISASSYDTSPFYDCSSSLKIYCGASSKPSGWGTYWNYYNETTTLSTTWGVTR